MQIACPNCGRLLEAPTPLPSSAKCPFCAAVFDPGSVPQQAAPVPLAAAAAPRSLMKDRTQGPGIALMIFGLLSLLGSLAGLAAILAGAPLMQGDLPADLAEAMEAAFAGPAPLVVNLLGTVLGILIALGGYGMMQLRWYPLAVTASILAMIQCNNCCCIIGIPLGIWALVVLLDQGVRSAFE